MQALRSVEGRLLEWPEQLSVEYGRNTGEERLNPFCHTGFGKPIQQRLLALAEMFPALMMHGKDAARAVAMASSWFMVRCSGPLAAMRAAPAKRRIARTEKRRATSATPSNQTVSPVM
jgi:hypothetical protein